MSDWSRQQGEHQNTGIFLRAQPGAAAVFYLLVQRRPKATADVTAREHL
jgi:hypothetical protein